MSADLSVVGLGRMDYGRALDIQRALAHRRIERTVTNDLLLLVEHPPVITLGRGFKTEHLVTPETALRQRGISVHEIERGGDITYHGPGQLVGYPIFDLTEHRPDLHHFLRQLEDSLIVTLQHFGLQGGRRTGLTGVWIEQRKIASIGIHVRKWVTWHGFALNVTTDLSYFDLIVPCGIQEVEMTSVQRELGERTPRDTWGQALDHVVLGVSEVFAMRPQAVALEELMGPSNSPSVI